MLSTIFIHSFREQNRFQNGIFHEKKTTRVFGSMTTAKWMDDNTTTLQNETPFNHLPTLLHLLSNSSTTHQSQSTPKQPTPQQSVAQSKSPAYDSKGAAYYICSVIVVYALAITLLVASLTKRKRKDQYQAANQHSTSEDYYVNIQKDWTLESSSNRSVAFLNRFFSKSIDLKIFFINFLLDRY